MKPQKAFTIRISVELHDQIEARAAVNHRTKNAEIVHLIEQAIDQQVTTDLKAARSGQRAI